MRKEAVLQNKENLKTRFLVLNSGFTLVETLVAGVIAIILGAAIVMVLNRGDMAFQQEMSLTDLQQQVRSAVNGMAREIRQASDSANVVIAGVFPNMQITFDRATGRFAAFGFIEVRYFLNNRQIIRQSPAGIGDRVLANNINNLTFTEPGGENTVFIEVGANIIHRRGRELVFSLVEKVRLRNE